MRNKRRNDQYIASRVDSILNKIPTSPYMGFFSSSRQSDLDVEDWDEQDINDEDSEFRRH